MSSETGGTSGSATQTEAMPDVETAFDEIEVEQPLVGIIMGSANDKPKMMKAGEALESEGIRYEVRVMSAHRDPETVAEYCKVARTRGLRVIIAGAGLSAALPGVAAERPGGIDALLATSQMPPGVPVGAVGIDNAKNAGLLAARIIKS